jgi:hypothetical protein
VPEFKNLKIPQKSQQATVVQAKSDEIETLPDVPEFKGLKITKSAQASVAKNET